MTPEKFARIREIYEGLLSRPALERRAYLEAECRGDEEIRNEVELLLNARERVPDWLAQPLLGQIPFAVPRMEGRHLGSYTLIREIGRGGMGSVYLAERSDGTFQKRVAIKVVQPGRAGAEFISRFRQEREILASLDHPNIAGLLDAGETEEGLPYLVMELVEGQPIQQWCDARKLNISERIRLMRTVCDAVRHAHQHLVVHRDLKPSNILVTADGAVKLLDFGIAKLLDDKQGSGLPATETLAQLMTPDYASPEQVSGTPVTTLTDVYSLGVICYELFTGHRPYRLSSAALHEMARVIAEVEPLRPSAVVDTTEPRAGGQETGAAITPEAVSEVREGDPAKLRNRLKGDLDCIVLTALQKEPARRYGSVEALEQDLQRHLEHRPVAAKPDDAWYRASRFIRRHVAAVVAVALAAITVLFGLAALTWQARLTLQAREGALPNSLWFTPFWVISSGFALAGCSAAVYFFRPSKRLLAGALAGGVAWALSYIGQYWIGFSLGWWRSRLAESSDPLGILSVPVFLLCTIVGAVVMLILSALGRRFGLKAQMLFIVFLGFLQPGRDRVWFTKFLPVMTADTSIMPFLSAAAIYMVGFSIGLMITQRIGSRRATRL
ncbi:MAG: protein kinase [Acidobacteria bacterium]|nr:protein kinase [Acidobacteriota bacterium]